jgi:hypothetical protein
MSRRNERALGPVLRLAWKEVSQAEKRCPRQKGRLHGDEPFYIRYQ